MAVIIPAFLETVCGALQMVGKALLPGEQGLRETEVYDPTWRGGDPSQRAV
ncbi:MAG: hypothetical protein ISR87_05935 [Candidatus Marinimicrobia bacterium]|nr:hypothetical protein [FCB group bacterium]MBL7024979.1 hypothetical protein [Candidatus Neomarinimicrobiota bacterium]